MSEAYLKSISPTYSKYFSQQESFERKLAKYDLSSGEITGSNSMGAPYSGGVPLSFNKKKNSVFVDDTDSHSLIIGATGSKKSRLIALPLVKLLGAAGESMIISDPKAEVFERTAKKLEQLGYDIKTINLRDPKSGNAWNPLSVPYEHYSKKNYDRAFEFANDIAVNLAGIHDSKKDPFWDQSASTFFFGLIMLLFKFCRDCKLDSGYVSIENLLRLRTFICADESGEITLANKLKKFAKGDPFIYSLLIGTVDTYSSTKAGILSVFDQKMRTFTIQPSLRSMLAGDTQLLDKIQQKPTAIFLILPDEKTSYHNLVSLFIKQSYEKLIFNAQEMRSRSDASLLRVNYILDEFSSLPTIHDFPAMITAARSRNIRFNLFVQSKHQLDLRYGEESYTIRANCNNWIFLVSREISLLQEVSELCGKRHKEGNTVPILSVTDLQRLDKELGEVLILSGRGKPYVAQLPDINMYDNDVFEIMEHETRLSNSQKYDITKKMTEYFKIEKQIHDVLNFDF